MLQIIGLLGCLYLFIKGLEIASSSAHCNADGRFSGPAIFAMLLAWLGAFVFGLWFLAQSAVPSGQYLQ